ncbi:Hpt domain-containing protein [Pelomonas sp. CA6]|uniref:Hpt domain-containing protein n=1 Tax=Pelomonas sp. CA6 TaxID=2907999 RepID=UPI001F4C209E|nr:Hpt domain-containing protein [Pelomonas sp. CA6]MCH7343989.1 Hpt domain-containing protein [Pelomonas sp. CA6]
MSSDPVHSPAPTGTTLDPQAIAQLRALDPSGANQLLDRVVGAFLRSLDQHSQMLAASRRDDADLAAVRHVAHTMKSASASLGARQLSQRCAELEQLAREGRRDGLQALLDATLQEMALARSAVHELIAPPP